MASTRPGPMNTRAFIAALKTARLTNVALIVVPKGDGHGLDAGAKLSPTGQLITIQHDQSGNLRTTPDRDTADARTRDAIGALEHIRKEAEDLYRSRMQEVAIQLAADFTDRIMAARAAGDVSFDVLAELPRDELAEAGIQTVKQLNTLAALHS